MRYMTFKKSIKTNNRHTTISFLKFFIIVTLFVVFYLNNFGLNIALADGDECMSPYLMWDQKVNASIRDIEIIDSNGDGSLEIIVSVVDWGDISWSIRSFDASTGNLIWSFNQSHKVGNLEVGDIDGNGFYEVIFLDWDDQLFILNGTNGKVLMNEEISSESGCSISVEDLNYDGIDEIILANGDIFLVDITGNLDLIIDSGEHYFDYISVGELNGDIHKDIVASRMYRGNNEELYLVAIDGSNFSTMWEYNIPQFNLNNAYYLSPNIIKIIETSSDVIVSYGLSGNGTTVNYSIVSFNGLNGNINWISNFSMTPFSLNLLICNINNDQNPDIIQFGNTIKAIDGVNGNVIWGINASCESAAIINIFANETKLILGYNVYSLEDGAYLFSMPRESNESIIGGVTVIKTLDSTLGSLPDIITGHFSPTGIRAFAFHIYSLEEDNYEPDDSFEEAKEISTYGITQKHNFYEPYDKDFVKFYGICNSTYIIQTKNLTEECDTVVELYDENGSLLSYNDDVSMGNLSSRIEWSCTENGTYYVLIRNYNGSIYGSNISYEISIQFYETIILPLFDDFEDTDIGSYPYLTGWHEMYSGYGALVPGEGAYVTDELSFSSNKSFKLQGLPNWSRTDYFIAFPPDRLVYGANIFVDNDSRGGSIGFGIKRGNYNPHYNRIVFGNDGNIYFSGKESNLIQPYSEKVWYRVVAYLNYVSETADVYINNQLRASGLPIYPKKFVDERWGNVTLDLFSLHTLNFQNGWISTVYFDDVMLYSTDDFENDNDEFSANIINPDVDSQLHNFHVPGDEDWVKFHANAGTKYVIKTVDLGINCDTEIFLIDIDGVTNIMYDDNSNSNEQKNASKIEWTCAKSGLYYVKIREKKERYGPNTNYDFFIETSSISILPTIKINSPIKYYETSVGNKINIKGKVIATNGDIDTIKIYIDDTHIYEDNYILKKEYNISYPWNTEGYELGGHKLYIKVIDDSGFVSVSDYIYINLKEREPSKSTVYDIGDLELPWDKANKLIRINFTYDVDLKDENFYFTAKIIPEGEEPFIKYHSTSSIGNVGYIFLKAPDIGQTKTYTLKAQMTPYSTYEENSDTDTLRFNITVKDKEKVNLTIHFVNKTEYVGDPCITYLCDEDLNDIYYRNTDSEGYVTFENIPLGHYYVKITHSGLLLVLKDFEIKELCHTINVSRNTPKFAAVRIITKHPKVGDEFIFRVDVKNYGNSDCKGSVDFIVKETGKKIVTYYDKKDIDFKNNSLKFYWKIDRSCANKDFTIKAELFPTFRNLTFQSDTSGIFHIHIPKYRPKEISYILILTAIALIMALSLITFFSINAIKTNRNIHKIGSRRLLKILLLGILLFISLSTILLLSWYYEFININEEVLVEGLIFIFSLSSGIVVFLFHNVTKNK